jgi:hypothetical protein
MDIIRKLERKYQDNYFAWIIKKYLAYSFKDEKILKKTSDVLGMKLKDKNGEEYIVTAYMPTYSSDW